MEVFEYAPAKLNLFLDILNKREDGYHEILTLMVKLNLYDLIKVDLSSNKKLIIDCNIENLKGKNNLVYRTVNEMRREFLIEENFKIWIQKNIPLSSGLGGASSDTASVMKAIIKLLGLKVREDELLRLGSRLGSDVNFFLQDFSWAIMGGKGDKILKKIDTKFSFWALLVYPGFEIATSESYKKWRPSLTKSSIQDKIRNCPGKIDWDFLKEINYNVFGELNTNSELEIIKNKLKEMGAEIVNMSGSGSTIYGLFAREEDAIYAQKKLKGYRHWKMYVVKTIN